MTIFKLLRLHLLTYKLTVLSITVLLTHQTSLADFVHGNYTYTIANESVTITRFNTAYSGDLSITNSLDGYPVTSLGHSVFYKCWDPAIQYDENFGLATGQFIFNISGIANIPIKIETTDDLSNGPWIPARNAVLNEFGTFLFIDPDTRFKTNQFYRIKFP